MRPIAISETWYHFAGVCALRTYGRGIGARLAPLQVGVGSVQWSEDVIKANPFFGRSRVRFRVPPWVSNTIARDHLA